MIGQDLELILNKAIRLANKRSHEFLSLESVLLAMLEEKTVLEVLRKCHADTSKLTEQLEDYLDEESNFSILNQEQIQELGKKQFVNDQLRDLAKENGIRYQPEIGLALQRVIQRAALHVQSSGKKSIKALNILVSLFSEKESHAVYFLKKQNISRIDIVEKIAHQSEDGEQSGEFAQESSSAKVDPLKKENPLEKALGEYTVNLNKKAKLNQLDPIVGRDAEIKRIIQILCRRRKNNPLLVGDAGVGKTAIAEGLAQFIEEGRVPKSLARTTIYSLDMASLLAGTKFRGDFEERLKLVLKALDKKNETGGSILFIDEIHTIIGAGSTSGGSLDASNLLKPALGHGGLRCMGSTTFDEFRKFFEKDQALTRRFQKVDVLEPSLEDTVSILEGIKGRFEDHHKVRYPLPIIRLAAELAQKHINQRKLPDKAIDVIDEVGSYLAIEGQKTELRNKGVETPHKPHKIEAYATAGVDKEERPDINETLIEKDRYQEVRSEDIEKIVAQMARIPEKSLSVRERDRLRYLAETLSL